MRLLYVVEHYAPFVGGVETLFQTLAERAAQAGHEVVVFTSRIPETAPQETLNGVKIIRCALPTFGQRYWFSLLAPWSLWRWAGWADLIHTTTFNAAWPAWLCGWLRKKPTILTVHEIWGREWFQRGMMPLVAWAHQTFEWFLFLLPFTAYIAVSDFTAVAVRQRLPNAKIILRIYHGIDNELFHPQPEAGQAIRQRLGLSADQFVALYFGRPGWAKGIDTLVAAAPQLARAIPNIRIVLILARHPESRYRAIQQQIEHQDPVVRPQVIDSVARQELPAYLAAANCVVVPSLSEGFGFTAAESCAMGIPVAVSTAGSLPEVVSGTVAFFRPGDSADLTRAVEDIARGTAEEIPLKTFSWSTALDQHFQLYHQLLTRHATSTLADRP